MKGHPTSYKDPIYDGLEAAVTSKLGLPEGLLTAIRTKGEKTNADKVSSAGARTAFQIIPATRNAIRDRYGVDAYESAENAVEAAGLVLKENLDRAGGDVKEAVAQYHAGTNPRARGPVNRAYVARVTGAQPSDGESATDRLINRSRRDPQDSAMIEVLARYQRGEMSPKEAENFKREVSSGNAKLPEGASLDVTSGKPATYTLTPGDVAKYADPMTSEVWRRQAKRLVDSGAAALPEGMSLVAPPNPADRSFAENMGRGVRNIATGVGAVGDIAAGALNATINLGSMAMGGDPLLSTSPFRDIANNASDAAGLKAPETRIDKLVAAGSEGAVGGMTGAGAGAALAGLPGAVGAAGRMLSAAPILDTVSGATSGVSSEVAAQNGAGPIGQLVAGLAGGVIPVGAVGAARAVAPKARSVVRSTPREVILDDAGKLTDEGREIAAREGVTADELAEAYDAPEPQMVRTYEGKDYPVEVIDPTPVVDAEGVPHIKVRGEDGAEGFVPQNEVRERSGFGPRVEEPSPATVVDEAAPAPAQETPGQAAPEAPLPASAAARVKEAKSLGVDLTRGQATNDSALQASDQDLAGIHSPEGKAVQAHFDNQKVRIKEVANEFEAKLGDRTLTPTERGQAVKDGLNSLFNQGRAGVNAAYAQLKKMVDELKGKVNPNLLNVEVGALREKVLDLLADNKARPEMQKGLAEIAARYGITGERAVFVPSTGMTKVMFRDADNNLVPGIAFRGKVEPLSLTNSEAMRQDISALYDRVSGKNPQESLNPMIDEAVTDASSRLAIGGNGGPPLDDIDVDVGRQALAAREAHKEVQRTFKGGDVIERLIARKRGMQTDAVKPEEVFAIINGKGPGSLTNIRKLKSVMLGNGPNKVATEASRQGWRAVQANTVAEIFQKATVRNTNLGDQGFGKISGAKLNTEIHNFGVEKLKIILDPEDFDHFMKIRRVAMATDIPLPNTYNASGSGHVVARLLGRMATKFMSVAGAAAGAAVGGPVGAAMGGSAGAVVDNMVSASKAASAAKNTVEGVTNFTAEQASKIDAPVNRESVPVGKAITDFLNLASSERLLAPLLAATQGQQRASQEQASERQAP